MQTFIPYGSDFQTAARTLDFGRLVAQCKEAAQILSTLKRGPFAKGYKNHPIVRMWKGFEPALASYGWIMCTEFTNRTGNPHQNFFDFNEIVQPEPFWTHGMICPRWLNHPSVIASHRAALVLKAPHYYKPFFPLVEPKLDYLWYDPDSKRFYTGQLSKPKTVRWHNA